MRLTAIVLLYFGMSSLLWGSYASGTFMPLVDIFLAIEGAIVTALVSLELQAYRKSFANLSSLELQALGKHFSTTKQTQAPALTRRVTVH